MDNDYIQLHQMDNIPIVYRKIPQKINSNINVISSLCPLHLDHTDTFIKLSKLNGSNKTIADIFNSNNSNLICISSQMDNDKNVILNHNNSKSTIFLSGNNNIHDIKSQQSKNSFSNIDYPYHSCNSDYLLPTLVTNGYNMYWNYDKQCSKIINIPSSINQIKEQLPYDLQTNEINVQISNDITEIDLNKFTNGIINIFPKNTGTYTLIIKNCSLKVTINNFTFNHLTISNCDNIKLNNCSFNYNGELTERFINKTDSYIDYHNMYDFILSNSTKFKIGLQTFNSNVFIKNDNKQMTFENYDISVLSNSISRIYFTNIDKIKINNNLNNCNLLRYRPIIFGAFKGSQIYYHANIYAMLQSNFTKDYITFENYQDTEYHLIQDKDTCTNKKYRQKTIPLVINFKDYTSIINHNHKKYKNDIMNFNICKNNNNISIPMYMMYHSLIGDYLPVNEITNTSEGSLFSKNNLFCGYNGNTDYSIPKIKSFQSSDSRVGQVQAHTQYALNNFNIIKGHYEIK